MRRQFCPRIALAAFALFVFQAAFAQVTTVRINEVLADNASSLNSDGSVTDLVELYNSGPVAIDLGGCSITDSNLFPRRYVFPVGTIMNSHAFLRLMFDSSFSNNLGIPNPPAGVKVPFGIKASGGYLFFYGPVDTIIPIDQVEFGLQIPDHSVGRVTDGTGPWQLTVPTLGAENVPAVVGSRSGLRVNEWFVKGGTDFIEIFNPTNQPVPIGGTFLSDTTVPITKFRVPDLSYIGTGVMGGFIRFKCDGDNTTPKYPADATNFKLGDNEVIVFTDTNGSSNLDFIPNWTTNQVSNVSQGRLPDGSANIVSFPKINDYDTMSPGDPNFLILSNLYVNEILTHTDPPLEDAVEFQNRGTTSINISGWWLSNSRTRRQRYQLPAGTAIAPGAFRVIYEGATNGVGFNGPTAPDPFTFNSAHGDNIVLSQVDANGNLTGYIAYEEFEASANGDSFGHYDTSVTNDYKFVAMSSVTFGVNDPRTISEFRTGTGQTNSYPRVGPIVINEIMFQPTNTTFLGTNGTNVFAENPAEEYIEIRNITSQTIPLYDPLYPTNHWKLQRAVEFILPRTNMGPNSFALVVGFDPYTNGTALDNFRTRFNVPLEVPIFGPWAGRLANNGDGVELYRPDPVQLPPHPDAGFVPYIRIDKVNYLSNSKWPPGGNGDNRSLQRKNSLLFGNDPINWAADFATPGRSTSGALLDTDGDGIPDAWETANGFDPNNSSDAAGDADADGMSNIGEYLANTNPRDASSFLQVAEILPFEGTNILVRFVAYSNATYTVQFRNSLLEGSDWQRLEDVPSLPTTRTVEVHDTNAWKKVDRYYRVRAPASN